jgi:hypothetical protein
MAFICEQTSFFMHFLMLTWLVGPMISDPRGLYHILWSYFDRLECS